MGKSYGDVLWGFLKWISNELSWAGQAWLGRAGPFWAGQGWPGLSWACKVQLKIPIRNPHNESSHNWNLAKFPNRKNYGKICLISWFGSYGDI